MMMGLRFSACIEMIFKDLPFLERLDRVADSGIGAFEFWRWDNKDIPAIAQRAQALGLTCAALVGSSGGPLVDLERRDDFLVGLRGAVVAAQTLSATTLIVTTGQAIVGVEREKQHASIVEGLRAAEPIARDAGLVLVLEPLNTLIDHAGYYLDSTREGLDIVAEVGSPSVRLLYDIYHAQVMEGNLTRTLIGNLDRIAHVHVADLPGRHEPGTGEIAYRHLFSELSRAGYDGFVGLEFRPMGDHAAALESTIALARP
jgi:hydroxypyruvate isomerase